KYTEVNDSYTNCLGYTRKEIIGHTAEELNIWVNPDETNKIIAYMKKQGKMREVEHSVRTKHGQIRNWVCSGDTININGEPYMIAVAKDITEQKAVEEKLQEHKKMIESILSTMPEGVLVIDGSQNILLANKALHKIFNLNSRSLKKKTLADIFPGEQFFDLHKAVKARNKERKNLEFRYQVEGLEKIINCVIVKMDGSRTLLCFSDISREREEEEKLYLTDRLASIGEMAAGLVHELNNPLTGILALSQMLAHANLSSEYREDLECINTEAKRAANIVKNVLLFARNKTGENSQSSVNDVVKNVLKLREYEEKISDITIVTNLEENLAPVPVDKWQLEQIFLNLISNAEGAIKEAGRPGIITIATQCTNNHASIIFSDNGCGIKKQIIPRIFDPFFTTKEIGKGTGLGLSICYSIIVKHGGKINVKSQVNEGTTFTIRLPVVR
ncbi:MAG: PAS domain S-box protein, partial [Dehalococcoidales bacterium]|nr:PAS domain S-box protein [Dehalococcoidales bacterium]